MTKLFQFGSVLLCLFCLNCGSKPAIKSEGGKLKSLSSTDIAENKAPEPVKPKTKKKSEPVQFQSVKEFINYYQKTLESLGQKRDDSSYLIPPEDVDLIKEHLAKLLQMEPSAITFLVNPRNQGAWFGNCTLIVDKKQEKLIIISKTGEDQSLSLKDKVFGGLYRTEEGEWVFLSAFYGDLQKRVPYRVFWGATELKVLSFGIDRTKEGTVEGQVKSPSGKMMSILRKGRDNKSVQVNGQTLNPVFE